MVEIEYIKYRPAGYTDDLGIIADRNQWVREQPEGWYVFCTLDKMDPVKNWLDENDIPYERYNYQFILTRKQDVVLLKLRWS